GVALVLIQFAIYFVGGTLLGADFHAGLLGIPVLFALAAMGALAIGAFSMMVALRTGSPEAVQGIFPLFFVALFLSSMNMPRNLIETDWFQWIATVNPVSYLIEGLRARVIAGWDVETLAIGFWVSLGAIVVALAISARAFSAR